MKSLRLPCWLLLTVSSLLSLTTFASKDEAKNVEEEDHIQPTLLSVLHPQDRNRYVNALNNPLYDLLLSADTEFIWKEDNDEAKGRLKIDKESSVTIENSRLLRQDDVTLKVDRAFISFDEPLIVSWHAKNKGSERSSSFITQDDDLIAMYCSSSDSEPFDPRSMMDVASIEQARYTSNHANYWRISSFPAVREQHCEFILWTRAYIPSVNRDLDTNAAAVFHMIGSSARVPIHKRSKAKPVGIHLSLPNTEQSLPSSSSSSVNIHYSTGEPELVYESLTPVVWYSPSDIDNAEEITARGVSTTYKAEELCASPANVTGPGKFHDPGLLHVVTLDGLMGGVEYNYRPGLLLVEGNNKEEYLWLDDTLTFTAPPSPSSREHHEPFQFLVYGDQGCPEKGYTGGALSVAKQITLDVLYRNTIDDDDDQGQPVVTTTATTTSDNITAAQPEIRLVHHIGDLSYAKGAGHIWDFWLNMISPYVTRVPLQVGIGNHEYDTIQNDETYHPDWGNFGNDSGGECGVPVSKRFALPTSNHDVMNTNVGQPRSNGVFWYAYTYASTFTIVLSTEHDISPSSPQYRWLSYTLSRKIDRSVTPWLIVEMHRPIYNAFDMPAETRVADNIRTEIEPLLVRHDVDVVFSGHYHSYFRSCNGLYQQECDNGGPFSYITIGTAGAKLSKAGVSEGYEHYTKAAMSEFGYGRVTVWNHTCMEFQFVGNVDGEVLDEVWFWK
mmetsp:Transcript_34845/g.51165  ORF Transcript_34845/g.51165 Transcript_34845/m.51165 type:complete len:725 (-) Transcript_34845:351-2525(-)